MKEVLHKTKLIKSSMETGFMLTNTQILLGKCVLCMTRGSLCCNLVVNGITVELQYLHFKKRGGQMSCIKIQSCRGHRTPCSNQGDHNLEHNACFRYIIVTINCGI
jgi:hypothetical protein